MATKKIRKNVMCRATLESMDVGDELCFHLREANRGSFMVEAKRIRNRDEREGRQGRVFSSRKDPNDCLRFIIKRMK